MKRNLILAICIVACLVLSGCSGGNVGGGIVPDDGFEPSVDEGAGSELHQRYEKYRSDSAIAFDSVPVAHEDCFVTEEVEGGVRIVDYVSDSKVVRIPGAFGDGGRTVVSIAEGAFADKNMRAIYIPDSVKQMDMGALEGCAGIVTVRLPRLFGGYLGYVFGADEYGKNAVTVPSSLDTVILGESVTEIPENAFSGCKTLSCVVLPQTAEKIGKFAFFECRDLVYADLGDSLAHIDTYAFAECNNLYAIDCGASVIGLGAFYRCISLNKITVSAIGNGEVAHLGYIFGAQTSEYGADFVPASLRTVTLGEDCKNIPPMAFARCDRITSVILPEGIESIGTRAFYRCRSLSKISFPDSLKSIGDDAFFGCDALVCVSFGQGLEDLGMQAFLDCGAIKSIELPESLREIKPSTFYGCKSLVTVKLGGVKKIGKDAFGECQRLVPMALDGIEVAEGNEALVTVSVTN